MSARIAFNCLPWYINNGGFHPELAPPLATRLAVIRQSGYDGVHAEVPADMSPVAYGQLVRDSGLVVAPGYFETSFAEPASIDAARKVAREHAALGLDRIFLAEAFGIHQERILTPAQGTGRDDGRLNRIIDGIGRAAEAMVAEGVTPCLHQHVGTLIETREELEVVLEAVPANVLLFGPDTGHLTWVGVDPVAQFIEKHRQRVGAVHIKDMRKSVANNVRNKKGSYWDASIDHIWTEPGRGEIDLDAVLNVLSGFGGWYVVEVDIADQPTVDETARISAAWLRSRLKGEERGRG